MEQPGQTTKAPLIQTQPAVRAGFELATEGIQLYVFANKDKTLRTLTHILCIFCNILCIFCSYSAHILCIFCAYIAYILHILRVEVWVMACFMHIFCV